VEGNSDGGENSYRVIEAKRSKKEVDLSNRL